jgi:hypothetical protein
MVKSEPQTGTKTYVINRAHFDEEDVFHARGSTVTVPAGKKVPKDWRPIEEVAPDEETSEKRTMHAMQRTRSRKPRGA